LPNRYRKELFRTSAPSANGVFSESAPEKVPPEGLCIPGRHVTERPVTTEERDKVTPRLMIVAGCRWFHIVAIQDVGVDECPHGCHCLFRNQTHPIQFVGKALINLSNPSCGLVSNGVTGDECGNQLFNMDLYGFGLLQGHLAQADLGSFAVGCDELDYLTPIGFANDARHVLTPSSRDAYRPVKFSTPDNCSTGQPTAATNRPCCA
jgi:hypothetical protein